MDLTSRLFAESLLKLMLREGLVDDAAVLAMADEHHLLAERSPHQAEARNELATAMRMAVIDHGPPPATDPRVQFEADFRRKQMVERTAMLAKEKGE